MRYSYNCTGKKIFYITHVLELLLYLVGREGLLTLACVLSMLAVLLARAYGDDDVGASAHAAAEVSTRASARLWRQ